MPADRQMQARQSLATAAATLSALRNLPSDSDLSDQATATRADLFLGLIAEAQGADSNVVLIRGRRALGHSPLDGPAPEPGPGVALLIPRSAPIDVAPGEPLEVSIAHAWGDEDFDGGVA